MRIWAEVCVRTPALVRNFDNGRGSLGQKKKIMVILQLLILKQQKKKTQSKANLGTNSAVGWSKVERKFDGLGPGYIDLLNKY